MTHDEALIRAMTVAPMSPSASFLAVGAVTWEKTWVLPAVFAPLVASRRGIQGRTSP